MDKRTLNKLERNSDTLRMLSSDFDIYYNGSESFIEAAEVVGREGDKIAMSGSRLLNQDGQFIRKGKAIMENDL